LEEIVAAPVKKTENTTGGIRCADHGTSSICKIWYYFAKKRRSLARHSSLADQSHEVFFCTDVYLNDFGNQVISRLSYYLSNSIVYGILEKLIVTHLVREAHAFTEVEDPLQSHKIPPFHRILS
jgi:hypothetical protein